MAVEAGQQGRRAAPTEEGPGRPRALPSGIVSAARRFLTLREGSVVVITVATALYFAIKTDRFATGGNFKTLLPYFAPVAILAAGEVFLMINGEIDLSIGAVYLFAPFLSSKLHHHGV